MTRKLTKLRIDEVSSCDVGAGEGTRIVLMKRHTPRNRFERLFRQIDFSKVKTNPLPDDDEIEADEDDTTALPGRMEEFIAALQASNPNLSRQEAVQYLLHSAHGRSAAAHMSSTFKRKEPPMDRAEGLRSIAKEFGVAKVAEMIAMEHDAHGISEHELTSLAFEEAKKQALPGERPELRFRPLVQRTRHSSNFARRSRSQNQHPHH